MKPNELEDIVRDIIKNYDKNIAEEMRPFLRANGRLRVGKWRKYCDKKTKRLIAQLLKRDDLFEYELKR